MKELNRVLVPGGIVAYRDPLAPNNLNKIKRAIYTHKSWITFIDWWLVQNKERLLKEDVYLNQGITILEKDQGRLIDAPAGIHREIQRHYLTFRDFILSSLENSRGEFNSFSPEEDTEDKQSRKRIYVSSEKLAGHINGKNFFKKIEKNDIIEIKQDKDGWSLGDIIIEYAFLCREDPSIQELLRAWTEREGSESYVYATVEELCRLCLEQPDEDGNVLYPSKIGECREVGRPLYQSYLKEVISDPEVEGKQLVRLTKMPETRARKIQGILQSTIWKSS